MLNTDIKILRFIKNVMLSLKIDIFIQILKKIFNYQTTMNFMYILKINVDKYIFLICFLFFEYFKKYRGF